ncbi:MAG: hypothetical protein SCALA702_25250 [Melioribacteraceae bacterium]|nr:MAG: hypothetical protein SCALA702_25250 [Melioribacteraceae bacterium]
MTYSEVMISSILIMFGSVFALVVMAFIISKKKNRNIKPAYAEVYQTPVVEKKIRHSEPRVRKEITNPAVVRFQTVSDGYSEKSTPESKRMIRSDRNMKALRESSYDDPKFRSVRAPRFRVVNSTMTF